MEIIDRYLQAVRFWLPRKQQDDIVAEISEDIRSQVEDQEAELGRKLNENEIGVILRKRGRPVLVANRYLPQQYLIGPVLFPIYQFVLKIVILCYLVPWLLVWVGFMSFDPHYRATHSVASDLIVAWGPFWLTTLTAIGIVTIVFAALERAQSKSKFVEDWEPRKLPPVRNVKLIPRFGSVMELGANLVFIVWWVNSMWSQTIFAQSGVHIVLAPAWRSFFWAFLLLAIANLTLSGVNLFRPYWTTLRGGIRLALNGAGSVVFCWLLKAHLLAEISAPNLSSSRAAEIMNAINTNMANSFPFAVMACLLILVLADVGRLVRLRTSTARLIQTLAAIVAIASIISGVGA
jgi:hypothetical protein